MDAERIDDVTDWEDAPFDGGFDELRALANRDFSGAVTAGTAWLFLLNGRVVGVVDGDLDDFDGASGTAYEAPHSSLPLLYAMQERGGEVRAKYYTNDTPLSTADRKLSSGNFTGYVELSENVLSGDYYTMYHGGNSLSAAFVGSAEKLKTGDEAFDLADDEVGIYKVYEVDLEVRDLPDSVGETGADADGTDSSRTTDSSPATGASSTTESSPVTGDSSAAESLSSADSGSADVDSSNGDSSDADSADSSVYDSRLSEDQIGGWDSDDEQEADGDAEDDAERLGGGSGESGSVSDSSASNGLESAADPVTSEAASETEDDGTAKDDAGGTAKDDADESDEQPDEVEASASGGSSASPDSVATDSTESLDEPSDPSAASAEQLSETSASDSDAERPDDAAPGDSDVFSQEAEWQETKSIPALDPDETEGGDPPAGAEDGGSLSPSQSDSARSETPAADPSVSSPTTTDPAAEKSSRTTDTNAGASDAADTASTVSDDVDSAGTTGDAATSASSSTDQTAEDVSQRPSVQKNDLQRRVGRLESALEETESRRQELEAERDDLAQERDRYEAKAEQLGSRVTELESKVTELKQRLEDARAQLPNGEQSMSPSQALAETNLFVRYDSQGGATLEKAHNGEMHREEVITNLRLEHHTSFEESNVLVNGRTYHEFLDESIEYGFTRWVVEDLLYEIRKTGNVSAMQDLYDAIPEIDRAEIGGEVSIHREENGETHRDHRQFDLVLRDRMGNALVVADLNDSRDPTEEGVLESLVSDAGHLVETNDNFVAAFAVTASFFEPGALEAVEDATGGGLFSRGKQKSFVKLSRKQGYHLCLVETRDGEFHLNVPEL